MRVAALFLALCAGLVAQAQHTLRGTVTSVDAGARRITVEHGAVPGWMGAMTMAYALDNPEVLAKLKAGDRITATVFDGDPVLHGVAAETAPAGNGGLTLEQLEQWALAGNPSLTQAEANVRAAAGMARQAGLYPNPVAGYSGEEIRGGYTAGGRQGAFVSQTIVTAGKLGAARRAAELHTAEVRSSAAVQRARVTNNVRGLYYHALAAQRMVEVRRDLLRLAEDALETANQLSNVGFLDRPDILQAQVEEQQAVVQLQVAERNQEAAWRMLAAVVNRPGLQVQPLEGDLDSIPDLEFTQAVAGAVSQSPEVTRALAAVSRSDAAITVARKAVIPDLQISAGLARNGEPLDTTRLPVGLQGAVQVGAQIPLFNRNQGGIAAARSEADSARAGAARIRLRIERDMAGLFGDYASARTTALRYRTELLPRAEQAWRMYGVSYRAMAAPYSQVLLTQRTLFQLRADYVGALESAWQSAIAIQGYGLTDGLSEPY